MVDAVRVTKIACPGEFLVYPGAAGLDVVQRAWRPGVTEPRRRSGDPVQTVMACCREQWSLLIIKMLIKWARSKWCARRRSACVGSCEIPFDAEDPPACLIIVTEHAAAQPARRPGVSRRSRESLGRRRRHGRAPKPGRAAKASDIQAGP